MCVAWLVLNEIHILLSFFLLDLRLNKISLSKYLRFSNFLLYSYGLISVILWGRINVLSKVPNRLKTT